MYNIHGLELIRGDETHSADYDLPAVFVVDGWVKVKLIFNDSKYDGKSEILTYTLCWKPLVPRCASRICLKLGYTQLAEELGYTQLSAKVIIS